MRDVMLILHFIGLAMGLGTSFGFIFIGIAASKMEKFDGQQFILKSSVLSKMGNIGLGLLFISGGYLLTPYFAHLGQMPWLVVKLVLFVVLGVLIGIMSSRLKKAQKGNVDEHLSVVNKLGKFSLIVALAIVVLAVSTFH